jgi:hypothetical protein
MMGDLVVTETEVPKVIDALQAHGIELTALHKHLLEQSPPVWWIHVHAMGDPVQLSQGLKAALDATAIPAPAPAPAVQPPVEVDAAGIDAALGRKGTADSGTYHNPDEQPRLFYLHFWAVDDAVTLAKAVRPALDATNVKPAS